MWENIVLIEAAATDQAFTRAEQRAREDEGDDSGSFTWGGRPAEWIFAGVRKLCKCVNPTERPGDGTEISYLELELESAEQLERFVEGKAVPLQWFDAGDEDGGETGRRGADGKTGR